MNLYEFIKSNDFKGFSLRLIRRFTKQMLSSLVLLKGHRVIHCDLKPENILLAHPAKSEIKVIDFGSSCFEHEKGDFSSTDTIKRMSMITYELCSVYLYPVSVLSLTRSHSWYDLRNANRYVEFGLHFGGTTDRVSYLSRRE